jgi:hypothetical protein
MDSQRHRTQKKHSDSDIKDSESSDLPTPSTFQNLLEAGAKEAYSRQWHRIERGLRLNRLRLFIEEISPQFNMTKDEKEQLFLFLQKALDKKLLNTLKVVAYDQTTQRITSIKGLEIKRNQDDILTFEFTNKKQRADTTRKKKKDDIPSVSTKNNS